MLSELEPDNQVEFLRTESGWAVLGLLICRLGVFRLRESIGRFKDVLLLPSQKVWPIDVSETLGRHFSRILLPLRSIFGLPARDNLVVPTSLVKISLNFLLASPFSLSLFSWTVYIGKRPFQSHAERCIGRLAALAERNQTKPTILASCSAQEFQIRGSAGAMGAFAALTLRLSLGFWLCVPVGKDIDREKCMRV